MNCFRAYAQPQGGHVPALVAVVAAILFYASGLQAAEIENAAPSVSPDGAHIAFVSNRDGMSDLYVICADGTGETRLTRTPEEETRPRWTENKHVAFSIFKDDVSRLFTIAIDGTGQTQIGLVHGHDPIPLKDGGRVLFSIGGWATMQLAIGKLDGSQSHQISNVSGAIWNAAVSNDGRWIAYTVSVKEGMQVWISSIDGSHARALTHFVASEGRPQLPAWSRDDTRLAIQSNSGDLKDAASHSAHIWIVDVATGHATKLAPHARPYLDEVPSWFPDGKRIAFQSNRAGQMNIWTMKEDGSDPRQVTK